MELALWNLLRYGPSTDKKRPRAGGTAGGMAQEVFAPMHHEDIPGEDFSPPGGEDARTEGGVLGLILEEHPALLTVPELSLA
jgi:hypothetical protein